MTQGFTIGEKVKPWRVGQTVTLLQGLMAYVPSHPDETTFSAFGKCVQKGWGARAKVLKCASGPAERRTVWARYLLEFEDGTRAWVYRLDADVEAV